MNIEANKFNKFLLDRNHSTKISFEDYIKYLKEYVDNDAFVDKLTKQRFESTISYLLSIIDVYEIDYKNKYIIMTNEVD